MAAPMSDISGYRSDGGGLGQDQGVSKQLRSILTAKLPLLSAPGTVLENSLYYDINSSSVTAVEEQATFAKDRIALNNYTFGSTPSAYIPSVLFANSVFWVPQFDPNITWPAPIVAPLAGGDLNIPLGWGFAALKNIIVYMGASSIAQIQISGQTNLQVCLASCETKGKRDKMLEGAGRYLNPYDSKSPIAGVPAVVVGVGQPLFQMTNYGNFFTPANVAVASGPSLYPPLSQAVVPLRLPWSSMAFLDKRLSLDTKLSTQPIQITLQTANLNEFTAIGASMTPRMGTAWKSSTIQMWQEELSDKSLSVRNELLAMPEFNVGYPFQYAQSIPFEVSPAAGDVGDAGVSPEMKLNITSIINSDLTTFLFNVTWNQRSTPSTNSGQYCPAFGEELVDIQLLLNGQRFFMFDNDMYPYVTLAKQLDDPGYGCWMPSQNTTLSGALSQAFRTNGNVYEFNNSRLRSIIAESHLQNTARFTNQTFQLSFKINRLSGYLMDQGNANAVTVNMYNNSGVGANLRSKGYSLNMTYLYNAVYLVGGDGGTTKLITN